MKHARRLLIIVTIFVIFLLIVRVTNLLGSQTGTSSRIPTTLDQSDLSFARHTDPVALVPHGTAARSDAAVGGECVTHPAMPYPLSPLEEELKRLADITAKVMADINATYWPADGTLLGIMRNGRVATDRDLDFQIHSTTKDCFAFLSSLRPHFQRYGKIKSFDVKKKKHNGSKIGRYAMVRMYREHGTFDTGPDFNCVYTDAPGGPAFFTHKGVFTTLPSAVYPLARCLMYGKEIPCPGDGMAFLHTLKPRYDGCMVFPHCFGPATHSSRKCLSPHPIFPMDTFVESTRQIAKCGYVSLATHFDTEPSCQRLMERASQAPADAMQCEQVNGDKICFLQKFID